MVMFVPESVCTASTMRLMMESASTGFWIGWRGTSLIIYRSRGKTPVTRATYTSEEEQRRKQVRITQQQKKRAHR
jgi:hypothetical protein